MATLVQFLFRLSFGLACGMALTSPKLVSSGYFRNHLYVLLGLAVLGTVVAWRSGGEFSIGPPLAAAIVSYAGAVAWLYEKPRAGIAALAIVSGLALWGAWAANHTSSGELSDWVVDLLDPLSSGLVLGWTIAAMFLGHWYLNAPGMALAPLRKLVALMGGAVLLRGLFCAATTWLAWRSGSLTRVDDWLFLSLRWLSGLIGALALVWMTWQTLKIPNTQSATGMLYVGVIATFLGELVSMLMSARTAFPV